MTKVKIEQRTVEIPAKVEQYTIYTCETCGKEYRYSSVVHKCHKCGKDICPNCEKLLYVVDAKFGYDGMDLNIVGKFDQGYTESIYLCSDCVDMEAFNQYKQQVQDVLQVTNIKLAKLKDKFLKGK